MPSANSRKPKSNPVSPASLPEWAYWAILIVPVLLIYGRTLSFEFTNWDDDEYVTRNPLIQSLTPASIQALFSDFYYLMYIPLTLLTYAVEYAWVGENPALFHATNVALHLGNTLLVFVLINQLVGKSTGSLLGALLFSLHPLRVESVAWVSERKDVLFVFFLLLALISWVAWRKENKMVYYMLSILALVLSSLSKATAVLFVPFVLLLESWFFSPGRFPAWKDKIPYLLIALLTGYIQLKGIQSAVETQQDATGYGTFENILILIYSYVFYWVKWFLPWPLSAYYPLPDKMNGGLSIGYYLSPIILIVLPLLLWRLYQKKEWSWIYAILWFSAGVFLFLKLRPGGFFIAGDRYTYAASIGISLAVAAWMNKQTILFRPTMLKISVAVLGVLGILSAIQTGIWKNSEQLFQSVIRQYPDFYMAYVNLGTAYEQKRQYPQALEAYRKAIELRPAYDQPWYNIGNVMLAMEKPSDAIQPFRNALSVNPGFTKAWNNLGSTYFKMEQYDSAVWCYHKALELEPDYPSAQSNLGQALLRSGKANEAYEWLEKALAAEPSDPRLRLQLGEAAEQSGRDSLALQLYAEAMRQAPEMPEPYLSTAGLYMKTGNLSETLKWLDTALARFPQFAPAWFNKGVILYQQGKMQEALPLFREAARLGHPQAMALLQQGTLK